MKMPGTNILRIFGICLTGKHHANVIMLKFKVFFFSVLLDFSLLNLEFRLTFFYTNLLFTCTLLCGNLQMSSCHFYELFSFTPLVQSELTIRQYM